MYKEIVFISHSINNNEEKLKLMLLLRSLNLDDSKKHIVPIAPYFYDSMALDLRDSLHLKKVMQNSHHILSSGIVKKLWLCGTEITQLMKEDIQVAKVNGIDIENFIDKV